MLAACPAVRLTVAVSVLAAWSRQLSMTCWPLTNSRLPSSLVREKV
jgi:hypothetical protein